MPPTPLSKVLVFVACKAGSKELRASRLALVNPTSSHRVELIHSHFLFAVDTLRTDQIIDPTVYTSRYEYALYPGQHNSRYKQIYVTIKHSLTNDVGSNRRS